MMGATTSERTIVLPLAPRPKAIVRYSLVADKSSGASGFSWIGVEVDCLALNAGCLRLRVQLLVKLQKFKKLPKLKHSEDCTF